MIFVVDCMLGKLAKWLRILGFDAVYDPEAGDDWILTVARKENRTLLTRDTGLLARAGKWPKLAVESESWPEQVRQVLNAFDLWGARAPYTRCLNCNVLLNPLSREAAANLVPSIV